MVEEAIVWAGHGDDMSKRLSWFFFGGLVDRNYRVDFKLPLLFLPVREYPNPIPNAQTNSDNATTRHRTTR